MTLSWHDIVRRAGKQAKNRQTPTLKAPQNLKQLAIFLQLRGGESARAGTRDALIKSL